MSKEDGRLSPPTVLRLSEYLLILEQFIKENKEIISSRELAQAYGNNANQVRQDIFHLENSGRVGQGYSTYELAEEIRRTLGLSDIRRVCIVGIGNLGKALATHVPFSDYGMKLTAAFDTETKVIGKTINEVIVEDYTVLAESIKEKNIDIGAICVPSNAAQAVCDILVEAGVTGILNYSRVRLKAPEHVSIQYQQVICSFMQLSYKVSHDD
jgi:redox-sensing transcriptional repressor